MSENPKELETLYGERFASRREYRNRVWQVLAQSFFQKFVRPTDAVLDLGCGYGEFIRNIRCATKCAMDLNPASAGILPKDVRFFQRDCSAEWPLPANTLDVVFTSNFFEHLPDKQTLAGTLEQAHRSLKPGGKLIALGPNIRYLAGPYWDFWDHYLPLTERSLSEGLRQRGFEIARCYPRFLPYTMVRGPAAPLFLLRWYLAVPWIWPLVGRQFLVIAVCSKESSHPAMVEREKDCERG